MANKNADFGVFGDEEVLSISKGRSYGMELLARTRKWFGLTGLLSYTLVWSEFKQYSNFKETPNYVPTAWDNRHILNITATKSFKHNWDLGFKWRLVGGAPYTPWDLEASALKRVYDVAGSPVLDYSRFNQLRFNAFHQLDVRADKSFLF
ncbi:MAG: hypothetical protein HC896_14645 [Bacteroidales bacterium]|nr:hypothetical protein [Bacteroidales bacterium]